MAEESRTDAVEKILTDQKSLDERRVALIADLLKQKEAAITAFDDRLAKLGYHANSKARRSHHKKAAASDDAAKTAKAKP